MAVIDRHRVARLMELSAAERTLKGLERMLREEDVAQLVRAAYDDASEKARADFMARVNQSPATAWPWSAVQMMTTRGGGGGGGLIGAPAPALTMPPPALILLLGQVDSPEADPANRIPDRDTLEGAAWAPLYKALDSWDTTTIKKWSHSVGWVIPGTQPSKAEAVDPPASSQGNGTTNGVTPTNGGAAPPATQADLLWTPQRVALVAGATVVVTGVAVYAAVSLSRARELNRLSERLRAQETAP